MNPDPLWQHAAKENFHIAIPSPESLYQRLYQRFGAVHKDPNKRPIEFAWTQVFVDEPAQQLDFTFVLNPSLPVVEFQARIFLDRQETLKVMLVSGGDLAAYFASAGLHTWIDRLIPGHLSMAINSRDHHKKAVWQFGINDSEPLLTLITSQLMYLEGLPAFLDRLLHFQLVSTLAVNSIYYILEEDAPKITLEII